MPLHAQYVYYESFTGTEAPGWTYVEGLTSPGPRLTADAAPDSSDPEYGSPQLDADGNGWLRLATTEGYQHNIVALDTAIPSNANTVTVTFDFTMWGGGGSNADGISLFVFDAAEPFSVGANGGSLAYEQKTGVPGLKGGYFAVGLDVYGNFSNDTEGRSGAYNINNPSSPLNISDSLHENQIVVRGPDQSGTVNTDTYTGTGNDSYNLLAYTGGYDYTESGTPAIKDLGGTNASNSYFYTNPGVDNQLDYANQDFRPDQDAIQYRRLQVSLNDQDELTVSVEFGKNTGLVELYTIDLDAAGFDRPENLRLGFGAATGGSLNVHEIRNLIVTASGLDDTWYWWNQTGDGLWNTANNWNPNSSTPNAQGDVVFGDKVGDFVVGSGDQFVTMNGDQTVGSVFFTGTHSYDISPSGSQTMTLDTNDGLNESYISITNNPDGNADHTLNVNLTAGNKVNIDNLVSQELTIGNSSTTRTFALGNYDLDVNSHGTTTIWSNISGYNQSDLVKDGSGRLNLYGNNQSYGGTITVNDGILAVRSQYGLGQSNPGTTVNDGGTLGLDTTSNTTFNELLTLYGTGHNGTGALRNLAGNNTWQGNITLGTGSDVGIGADAGTTLSISGSISGSGNYVNVGDGTVRLTTGNSYSGSTTVRSGTLEFTQAGALGSGAIQIGDSSTASNAAPRLLMGVATGLSSNITVNDYGSSATIGGSFTSGTGDFNGTITLNRDVTLEAAGTSLVRFQGSMNDGAGEYGVTKTGTGTVELSGAGTWNVQGQSYVNEGTLRLNRGGGNSIGGDLTIGDGTGTDTVTYYNSNNQIADTANVYLASSGVLNLNNRTDVIGSLGGAAGSSVALGSTAQLTAGGNDASTTFDGSLSGTGSSWFTKQGTGTLTMGGTNTFTGTLRVDEGTVALGASNVFSDSMTLLFSGGTFNTGAFSDTIGEVDIDANSTLDFDSNVGKLRFVGADASLSGTLSITNWDGDLTGGGNSALQFNTQAGAQAFDGVTRFADYDNAAGLAVNMGSYWEIVPVLTGWEQWDSNMNGASTTNWGTGNNWVDDSAPSNSTTTNVLFGALTPAGDNVYLEGEKTVRNMAISSDNAFTFSGNILNFNTDGGLYSNLTVTGTSAPTFSNAIDVEDNLNITNNSTGTVTLDGTMRLRQNSGVSDLRVRGSGTTVINGSIQDRSDNDTVTKDGTGTLRLAGNNSYGGNFTLNNGTVQIGSDTALGDGGSGIVVVNGGRMDAWDGDRSLSRSLQINGDFSVGDAAGDSESTPLLTFTNANTLSGARTITVDANAGLTLSGNTSGSGSLTKAGAGTLTLGGSGSTFNGGVNLTAGTLALTGGSSYTLGGTSSYTGSGDVNVSGGTFDATGMGSANFTIDSGNALNVSGGTFDWEATGTSADIAINGMLNSSGGTTTISTGDDVTLGGTVNISGGTVTLNGRDDFNGTGTVNMSGGTFNVDMTGMGSGNAALDFTNASVSLNGSGTTMNLANETGTTVLFSGGTLNVQNGAAVNVTSGDVTLRNGVDFNGGTDTTKGSLTINEDLYIGQVDVANRPDITINADSDTEIAKDSAYAPSEISIINLGTITKNGAGTTTINANINNIEASTVVINEGTLLLGDDDQLANSDDMVLNSGTFATGGNSEILDRLTLSTSSTIDMGNGASILEFEGGGTRTTGVLTVDNWSGIISYGNGTDQLIFGESLSSAFLSNVYWVDQNIWGAVQLASGEIVPVPEPAVVITCVMIVGAIGYDIRRRKKAVVK